MNKKNSIHTCHSSVQTLRDWDTDNHWVTRAWGSDIRWKKNMQLSLCVMTGFVIRNNSWQLLDWPGGRRWHSWLRHCATSSTALGSMRSLRFIIDLFLLAALRSTQPPTETSTRSILGGKGGRCVGLTTCKLHVSIVYKFGKPQPPTALRASLLLMGFVLPFIDWPDKGGLDGRDIW